jgi:hypothetical protein
MKLKPSTVVCALVLALLLPAFAFADEILITYDFDAELIHDGAFGSWELQNSRLLQRDRRHHMAQINFPAPQRGTMEYRFDVRYEGGGEEDRMGGFGLHIFITEPADSRSWGNGASYLLWINFDPRASYGMPGFVAQVYESKNDFTMQLLKDYQLKLDTDMLKREYLSLEIPLRIQVNGSTGLVKVYDPRRENYYYKFRLPSPADRGSHVALRTNSLAVSFGGLSIRHVR